MPTLYTELADWWPLLSPPGEYLDEAAFFRQQLADANLPDAPTLLELGCGGGSLAFHLKKGFAQVTLTDLSPQMLEVSRALNPECENIAGDLRTLRLGRTFDVVFAHDAIDYMTTLQDLRLAIETAYVHCAPGGLAIFVPDYVRETFEPDTDHGGNDSADPDDARAMRYLEWTYDPDETDTTYTTDYAYLLREKDGSTRVEHDRHILGLFARGEWLDLLHATGFQPEIVTDQYERNVFIARRPT